MPANRVDILDINIESGTINRSFQNRAIGEGDVYGNRYGVRVLRNGEEVDLSGVAVVGYFVRPDGESVAISGSRSGSTCWVDVPAACYVQEGNFTLTIKLSGGGMTMTARIVDGTVVDTVEGEILDPGSVIPSLEDYADLVDRIEAAAAVIGAYSITNTLIEGTRYRINVATA